MLALDLHGRAEVEEVADRILALVDAEPGWISVKDRLPTEEENTCPLPVFLVVCRTNGGYNGAYRSVHKAAFYPDMKADPDIPDDKPTEHYWEIEWEGMSIPFDVTHWRPLPKPPEEEP
jgi:hypothetical protein